MNALKASVALALIVAASGCASSSGEIQSAYVSPMAYDGYSCQQILQENTQLQSRITSTAGAVDKKAHGDKVKMGVGLVLFWPTLFFLKGDGTEAQEYARLKGQHEALEAAYTQKNCRNAAVATNPAGAASTASSQAVVRLSPENSYKGAFADAAKIELVKLQCSDGFGFVSESSGRGIYEATCTNGKRQLLECRSGSCKTMN